MQRDPQCEQYIGDYNTARGFLGANCGTWLGGLSANCKSQQYYANYNRQACYTAKGEYAQGKETTVTVVSLLKWAAIAVIVFYLLKWYLK